MTHIYKEASVRLKPGDKLRLRCVHGSTSDEVITIDKPMKDDPACDLVASFTVRSVGRKEDGGCVYSLPASEFDAYLAGRIDAFKSRSGIDSGGVGTGPYYFKLILERTKEEA